MQQPQRPKTPSKKLILHPHMQPSHKFNLWLALLQRFGNGGQINEDWGIDSKNLCILRSS